MVRENRGDSACSMAEQVAFEQAVLDAPGVLKNWIFYLESRINAPWPEREQIFERAVEALPASYKIWRMYLREVRQRCKDLPLIDPQFERANNVHERAFLFLRAVCFSRPNTSVIATVV